MKHWVVLALLSLFLLPGCVGEKSESARLHNAQRDFWRAKHFQRRMDIYPNQTIAEECLAKYEDLIERFPPDALPAQIDDPESIGVKQARVGAMAALGAAGIYRELGQLEKSISRLQMACREDLPLGAFVERSLRGTLGSFLTDAGRPQEALMAYRSLLVPLAPELVETHAAYPDEEVLAMPKLILDLAKDLDDRELLEETEQFVADYFTRLSEGYAGTDAERFGLLQAADIAMEQERWEKASGILERLAEQFPEQQPWRADIKRAFLLSEHLGRKLESEEILMRWSESRDKEATVEAGKQRIRMYIGAGRHSDAEDELRRVKRLVHKRDDKAELLYLWGVFEDERGNWEEARPRWGQSAVTLPYSRWGLESQLNVAKEWAKRGEARFAARALSRLFTASRRNTRHSAGSEQARLSLEIESCADSLLGTLPATELTVRNLLDKRSPRSDAP